MKLLDLVVIGAGPAGMAAAVMAAKMGLGVTLIDDQPAPGGQIFRNLTGTTNRQRTVLGPDYVAGEPLIARFHDATLTRLSSSVVWDVTEDGVVTYTRNKQAQRVCARFILIATGATERAIPLPGWTLPGVMTAGAAQIMLKSGGLLPRNAVLAGSGPLLYLLANQLVTAGAAPKALVETQSRRNYLAACSHVGGAVKGWRTVAKGLGLLANLRRAKVTRYMGASDLAVLGGDSATGLRFLSDGRTHELSCDTVLLHQGVVPNTQISHSLGLDHRWNSARHCFEPVLNIWGQTSNPRVFVAGDGGRILGAKAAELQGELAAIEILHQIGRMDSVARDELAISPRRALMRETAVRPFLDAIYAPPQDITCPADNVTICRCEEVTAGDVRRYAGLGCSGPNQTKAFGRVGMGPCQGRYCGLTVTELLAQATGRTPEQVGYFRIRAPLKPVTLGEIAALADSAETPREGTD